MVGLPPYAIIFPFLFRRLYLVCLLPLIHHWNPIFDSVFAHGSVALYSPLLSCLHVLVLCKVVISVAVATNVLHAETPTSLNVPFWRIILTLNQISTHVRLPAKDHWFLLFINAIYERSSHLSITVNLNKVPAPVSLCIYVPLNSVIMFLFWAVGIYMCVARKKH